MDPSKDQDSQKHQRGTKTTKKEEDSNKKRKPPGNRQMLPSRPPGPHRSIKYTGKEAPNKNSIPRRKNLMLPPRPIQKSNQSRGTSSSSRPLLPSITTSMRSRETSTSSGLPPRHPSNNSKSQQRSSSAPLRRIENSTSLVTMGSDDTSRRNNVKLPFRLPPIRTNDIVPQNIVQYNGPYVPPLNLQQQQKSPGRYLSRQPVSTFQSPLLTALHFLTMSDSTQRRPSGLFSSNSSSSTSRTVLDDLQASNNSQITTPENRIEIIQQNLSALQRGTIALLGFEEDERILRFTFQYEDYHDTIIYYKNSRNLATFITKNGKAVRFDIIPTPVREVFDQQKRLIRNTIWNKVSFNDKDYVLVFGKKSNKFAYLTLKDGKYVFIALEDCENDLKQFLVFQAISMQENYSEETFFPDLEKDLQSIYHAYTDPDDGIRKVAQNKTNKTWTYKNDIIFSVEPNYTMTNVTSKVKELMKKLEENPDDETLKNLYYNEYLEKPIRDSDADINLIQEKLQEMKSKRGL